MKEAILSILVFCCYSSHSQTYKEIHHKAILVDAHNDFPSSSIEKKVLFDSNLAGKTHTDLNRLISGGVDVQIFSIWSDGLQTHSFSWANRQIDSVHAWVKRNPGQMVLVSSPAELKKALKKNKMAAMIGVEGGHMIENKLEYLDSFNKRGVSYLTITHNESPGWASSAKDELTRSDSMFQTGLNEFGVRVIKKMNELGMLIDVSHAGEKTFWDIIRYSTKPIIASHSSAWDLTPHRRNLKKDQIKAIAKNGGIIHVNFYAGFLDSAYEKHMDEFIKKHQEEINALTAQKIQKDYAITMVSEKYPGELIAFQPHISALLDHIDFIVQLAGIDHVGLGSDFDGIEASVVELNGVEDFPLVTKGLVERGYSKKDIEKILGENFIRVFKANKN